MKKIAIVAVIGLMGFWLYRNTYFSVNALEGTYINNNTHPILEGPGAGIDTLKIYTDYTYENKIWGKGTFEIEGSRITFKPLLDSGAIYSTSLHRPLFNQEIRIALNSDLVFFYEKINEP